MPQPSEPEPEIRRARPADALAIAEVHVRAWQAAYRGLIEAEFLEALDPEQRARSYDLGSSSPGAPETLVVVEGGAEGAVRGFVAFGPSRDGDVVGEIRALYVDPDHWRRGLGRLLLLHACRRLRVIGFSEALLWVLVGNRPAERFYLANGWRRDGAERDEAPYGVDVRVFRLRRLL